MTEFMPKYPDIIMGIFPHAFEVHPNKEGDGFLVVFDPQKFLITPAHAMVCSKFGWDLDKIFYDQKRNTINVELTSL